MRMNAVLSNPKHPEYGQFTVPLPIPHNQYDGIMEALNAMDMGDPLARDCQMDEILGEYPILKRLEGKPVNIDELDYLAKRLDSFCYGTITGCSGYHIVPFTGQYFPRTESAALWWHYGYCRPKTFTKNQSEENCSGSQGR